MSFATPLCRVVDAQIHKSQAVQVRTENRIKAHPSSSSSGPSSSRKLTIIQSPEATLQTLPIFQSFVPNLKSFKMSNNGQGANKMTQSDAARIQSAQAKQGQAGADTFAARAQAAGDRNANAGHSAGGNQGGQQGGHGGNAQAGNGGNGGKK
ncbi:hypothetical protein BJ508DRAFT_357202 [Ascobolus immersus RN42]|uniref:SMP domain-containing protein n=1 Tax=Ascobolus immersus RN42 TaxID=1160509 RepID=A0A3N4IN60_ASCIM|nr:hypothetical protein BJ508DRAFT_357202 [Ascobolus immersus RN42]